MSVNVVVKGNGHTEPSAGPIQLQSGATVNIHARVHQHSRFKHWIVKFPDEPEVIVEDNPIVVDETYDGAEIQAVFENETLPIIFAHVPALIVVGLLYLLFRKK